MNPSMQQGGDSESAEPKHVAPGQKTKDSRPLHESLMSHVLEATLVGGDSSLTEAEWESLSQVAREHPPNASLQLAIACQLVTALLKTRFATLSQDKATLHQMSLRIAGSLWTHARSQQHLLRFWELLSSEVRK
jgi:hypothetical protein